MKARKAKAKGFKNVVANAQLAIKEAANDVSASMGLPEHWDLIAKVAGIYAVEQSRAKDKYTWAFPLVDAFIYDHEHH